MLACLRILILKLVKLNNIISQKNRGNSRHIGYSLFGVFSMNVSYYLQNRETILKKQAEYRAANKDKIREYNRKRYARNAANSSAKVSERQKQILIEVN